MVPSDLAIRLHNLLPTLLPIADGIAYAYREGSAITTEKDSGNDFATVADERAEMAIRAVLRERFPTHAILGEEFGSEGSSDYEWVIDPIDGTKFFRHAMPFFVMSVGLRYRGVPLYGILIEATGRTLTGGIGMGVELDGHILPPPPARSLKDMQVYFDTVGRDTIPSESRCDRYALITRILDESYRGRTIGASCIAAFGVATWLFGAIVDIFGGMKVTDRIAFTAILLELGMEERWVDIGGVKNFWIGHPSILDELESFISR